MHFRKQAFQHVADESRPCDQGEASKFKPDQEVWKAKKKPLPVDKVGSISSSITFCVVQIFPV